MQRNRILARSLGQVDDGLGVHGGVCLGCARLVAGGRQLLGHLLLDRGLRWRLELALDLLGSGNDLLPAGLFLGLIERVFTRCHVALG